MAGQAEPGRLVGGRYRLLARLGSGGMGRVWRASDEALRIEVAVKEVWLPAAPGPDADERLRRAEREARNAARLRDHPNVVAVHDVVVEDGVPWTVMQLVAGHTLEEHVERVRPAVGGARRPGRRRAAATRWRRRTRRGSCTAT